MKNTIKYYQKIFIVLSIIVLGSCSEDFLDQETPHIIAPDNLYVDEAGFDAGLNGLYASVRIERAGFPSGGSSPGSSNNLMCGFMMCGTDNIYANRTFGAERWNNTWGEDILGNGALSYFENSWNWLYEVNNAANTIINRAENYGGSDISAEKLNRIIAEARTIRAWAYRHLTYLFGDVPLVTEESTGENVRLDWERTPIDQVRAQMKEDLEFGAAYLPEEHLTDGKIIRAVAQHYLAELLIVEGEYTEAVNVALDAINGPRALITSRYGVNSSSAGTPFSDMFIDGNSKPSQGNTEALWVFQNEFEVVGGEGHNIMRRWFISDYNSRSSGGFGIEITPERGGRGLGRMSATNFQFDLYRDGSGTVIDDRGDEHAWRTYFVVTEEDNPVGGYNPEDTIWLDFDEPEAEGQRGRPYVRKWDWSHDLDPSESRGYNDQVYLRLADTYLLLAEAYHKDGDNINAAIYINALRDRANAPQITSGDVNIDFILDERARELFTEEHRRYTLLRNDKWIERVDAHNPMASGNVTNRDKLFPIPQSFIDANLEGDIQNNPDY